MRETSPTSRPLQTPSPRCVSGSGSRTFAIFSLIFHARAPGPGGGSFLLYLCAGMVAWIGLSEGLGRQLQVFSEFAPIMRKVQLSPEIPVAYAALSAYVSAALHLVALCFLSLICLGRGGLCCLWGFLLLPLLFVFVWAWGRVLAVAVVFIPDLRQFFPMALQCVFWATPICYSPQQLPTWLSALPWLNPAAGFVGLFQDLLYGGQWPSLVHLDSLACWSAIVLLAGQLVMRAHGRQIVKRL